MSSTRLKLLFIVSVIVVIYGSNDLSEKYKHLYCSLRSDTPEQNKLLLSYNSLTCMLNL